MAEMMKPDATLDGQEFSALTRLLEALHARKDIGVDENGLKAADKAVKALQANDFVAVDDFGALVDAAKAYEKAVEDDKLESVPNVKDLELKKIIKKLEGMEEAKDVTDKDGNKIHPAAQVAGAHVVKPNTADNDPSIQKVQIIDPKEEEKKAEAKQKAEDEKTQGKPASAPVESKKK